MQKIMFGFGITELIVILIIVLIIFGAGKLPEIGSGLGKGIKNFKKERGPPLAAALPLTKAPMV